MGGRLLRKWLGQPLLDVPELNKRQDAIGWFTAKALERRKIIDILKNVADLERLINRVRSEIAIPRELVTLRRSLEAIPKLKEILEAGDGAINWLREELKPLQTQIDLISQAIVDEPSSSLGEGGVIKKGFSEELDTLREVSGNAKQYLAGLELKERERTGIKNLKVGFNNVFGYYIEVSNANLKQVPVDYIRKQTLVNGERFFTAELKEYESMILNARDRIEQMETDLYHRVCRQVAAESEIILALGSALAHLDVFASLAEIAVRNSYVRPSLDRGNIIDIQQGRHPVVERSLTDGSFIQIGRAHV